MLSGRAWPGRWWWRLEAKPVVVDLGAFEEPRPLALGSQGVVICAIGFTQRLFPMAKCRHRQRDAMARLAQTLVRQHIAEIDGWQNFMIIE